MAAGAAPRPPAHVVALPAAAALPAMACPVWPSPVPLDPPVPLAAPVPLGTPVLLAATAARILRHCRSITSHIPKPIRSRTQGMMAMTARAGWVVSLTPVA